MRVLQEQNSVKVQIFVEVQKKCYDSILLDTTQKQSRPFISSKRYNTRFKTKYGFLQNNQTWLINKKVNNIKNDDLPIGVFLWIKVERKIYNPKLKPENMWSNNYTKKVEVGVLVLWYFFLFDFENFLSDVERFKEKKKKSEMAVADKQWYHAEQSFQPTTSKFLLAKQKASVSILSLSRVSLGHLWLKTKLCVRLWLVWYK